MNWLTMTIVGNLFWFAYCKAIESTKMSDRAKLAWIANGSYLIGSAVTYAILKY